MLFYFILCTHEATIQWVLSWYRWSPWFNWQYTVIEHLVTPPKRTLSSCFSPSCFSARREVRWLSVRRYPLNLATKRVIGCFFSILRWAREDFEGSAEMRKIGLLLSGGWTFVLSREKEDNCFSLRGELHSYFAGTFIEKKLWGINALIF